MKQQQELIDELLNNAKIPALSVSWCQIGTIHAMACGSTDISAPKPVETSTLFPAASLSKPVSAAIVLDLVEQGKWALDRRLFEYAPFGPPEIQRDKNYQQLTTRMIIGQCSGLPNWFEEGSEKKFIATPNTRFTYSGVALDFLKQVIEEKMQEKWEAIAQAFFTKAGMKTSTFKQLPASHLNKTPDVAVARAHLADGTPLPIAPIDSPEVPAGSLLTTAQDYITFLQYCYHNDFLRSKLLTGALTTLPPTSSKSAEIQWCLGMGVYSNSDSKKTITFHWGGGKNAGSSAFCAMNMATGDCVVCFANSDNGKSVIQQVVKPIVGDITTLFQWLAKYCGFEDIPPQKPDTTVKIAQLIHLWAEELSTLSQPPTPSSSK